MPDQSTTFVGGAPIQLSEEQVVALAREHTFGLPVGFFVGMAIRESGRTSNQVDTDFDSEGNPRPAKTYGLLMLRRDEAAKALGLAETLAPESTLTDPGTNLAIGAQIFARYRDVLSVANGTHTVGPVSASDIAAHVGLAHNWGLARETRLVISRGINAETFIANNQDGEWWRQARYARTIVEYCQKYPDVGRGRDTWWGKAAVLVALVWMLMKSHGAGA